MVDHGLIAGTRILRRQGGARDREAAAERDHQEGHGEAHRHGRDRRGAEAADPEGVGDLVAGLQQVREDDGDRQPEQGAKDGWLGRFRGQGHAGRRLPD